MDLHVFTFELLLISWSGFYGPKSEEFDHLAADTEQIFQHFKSLLSNKMHVLLIMLMNFIKLLIAPNSSRGTQGSVLMNVCSDAHFSWLVQYAEQIVNNIFSQGHAMN